MKKLTSIRVLQVALLFSALLIAGMAGAQSAKDKKLIKDAAAGKEAFLSSDALMKNLFNEAYGYAIFPNIGKGGIGIGGAAGNGIVYEKGAMIGKASMRQVNIGFQFGGQAYREVIFFENKETLDRFKENKVELSAQVSAIAVKTGAAATAKYAEGVMIFTQQKGGLMYEATVGGQKFEFSPF
ncbi:lipid-binding SYLF domain-containing protein [Flavisolibacter nicotianae]|uniref:lipid-binding SYLF domain-containing protein n=1 Tax=Flavisolibacter nicotianae TaxID=2364882 RepID=UPI000EB59CB5|nr:YSC84-related protein [Flavisolibacter nicotianae]